MSERNASRPSRPVLGFTLMELMIVVVVISILSLVAMNSYQSSVRKGRRADVQGVMMDRSQAMERFYTNNNTYVGYLSGAGALDDARVKTYYDLTFDTGGLATSATAYQIVATPKGPQTKDSCGTLKINQAGAKLPTTAGCWQ